MSTQENPEKKYQKLVDIALQAANLTVWEYDIVNHRITFLDDISKQHTEKHFNITEIVENVPQSIVRYLTKESGETLLALYRKLEDGAPSASCDIWYDTLPGEEAKCEHVEYTTLFDDNHRPVAAYGISQDVTAQKLNEKKFEKAFRQLSEMHPLSLGSFHLNLTKNTCSDGKSPFDFVLKQQESGTVDGYFAEFAKLIADDDIKANFFETFERQKLIDGFYEGTTVVSLEYPIIYNDGNVYWRKGMLYLIENPSTHDIEGVTYAIDIDERKKFELASDAAVTDLCDYIALVNPNHNTTEFLSFKHYENVEGFLHHKTPYEQDDSYFVDHFIVPDERQNFKEKTKLKNIVAELEKNGTYVITFRQIAEDGKELRKQLRYSWLDQFKREFVAVQTDMTEAYNLEQTRLRELQRALALAEKANEAKTEFIARISHDIRTPIGAISNMTDFALQDIGSPEKLRDDLNKIKTSNMFLLSLINDVLDISKIDSGKIELHPEPYPFEEYRANLTQMFGPICAEKGIEFSVRHEIPCGIIVADKIRINQILFNIVSNAVKYTPKGGSVIYESLSRNTDSGEILYSYRVIDTGIGMSESYQQKLFQPFTQDYDNPNRPKTETGTGLGLSIVKRLVSLMGGTVSIESALGKGTTVAVNIRLPMMTQEEYDARTQKAELRHDAQKKKLDGTVLVAEDNEINREIAVRILKEFGLSVVTAENGAEAVRLFSEAAPGTYRTVFMDLQMPVMDGYEATRKIRALPGGAAVPIYAMTANAFTEAAEQCRCAGMNGQLLKPIDPSELYEAVEKEKKEN